MAASNALAFVTQLAKDLSAGAVRLPSLPDVVLKIRKLLEQDDCDFGKVSQVVSADAMLVSRLLVFANSVTYNPGGERVQSLEVAIQRLGFELVRNAAIALAVKQLYLGKQHGAVVEDVRALWSRSMQLSALGHSIAARQGHLNKETAYLCGLLHDIGGLYILTKAKDFPDFLGTPGELQNVLVEWQAKIGKSILETWDFPPPVCESANPSAYLDEHTHVEASFADVMFVAERMLAADVDGAPNFATMPSSVRLGMTDELAEDIIADYQRKLLQVRETLA